MITGQRRGSLFGYAKIHPPACAKLMGDQLTAASLFSIAALGFTIVLHCCISLSPRLNLAINELLFVL